MAAKNHYTFITSLFLVLFLVTIFLFSRRSLESSLSLYRDFFPQINFQVSPPNSTNDYSLTHKPASPISQTQKANSDIDAEKEVPASDPELLNRTMDSSVSGENREDPVPDSELLNRTTDSGVHAEPISGENKEDPVSDSELLNRTVDSNVHAESISGENKRVSNSELLNRTIDSNVHAEPISGENEGDRISDSEPLNRTIDFSVSGESKEDSVSDSELLNRTIDSNDHAEPISGENKGDPFSDSEPVVNLGDNVSETLIQNIKNCDFYMGTWMKDEEYPIYRPGSCPYVDEAYDCQNNGRPDSNYTKWRWKPDACDLPRFNATDFLARLRGKRLMLVGDSMNRNQFESILCLLREVLPDKSKMYEIHGHRITKGRGYYVFKFMDYNCSVEFVRSHFLVREGVRINAQGNSNPTLSIDRIDKTSGRWKRADILVFNTGHWWTHGKTARGKNYYKEGDYLYPKFDAVEAYRRALKTWAKWIDENVNPAKQIVFYRGYSSAHFRGGDWDSGGSCNGEKEPVLNGTMIDNYPLKMKIVEEVIQEMQFPVKLLNVTRLTNFRKDGHPSVYGKNMTAARKISARKQDCSHWCLPGVPDAWNELIYASLVLEQTFSKS